MSAKNLMLDIAIATSRETKKWKNKKITWGTLTEKLSKVHRTHETFAEYQKFKRDRRDAIKDVGGFVGGYLVGGKRTSGAVLHRSIITLDADNANPDFWDIFTIFYGCAACCYSTHGHSADKPRYRLVIPLNRNVEPAEYQPIARRIAGDIDIEMFDNTGFQDERLMYWPSAATDGAFEFYKQDGPALDADRVLSTYVNWQDISEWPVSEKVGELVLRSMKKQGDPLEKKGVIGAFCRAYTIDDVIEKYLNEVYEESEKENRYTFLGGTTAAGLVVYDGKFAYSHHNTDPCGGLLCNAFDLARLHLFEDDDKGIDSDTPVTDRPSFAAMQRLAGEDAKVREQIGIERLESAKADFEAVGLIDEDYDTEWLGTLAVDTDGKYKHTSNNIVTILDNDPMLKQCIAYDEFRKKAFVVKRLPWRDHTDDQLWSDNDESHVRWYVEKVYGISSPGKVKDAIEVVMRKYSYHPVRRYLNDLKWDGEFRIDTLLIDFFGAEDTEYVRTVTRRTLIAAVARIMQPGCKNDTMLVLVGKQGLKKSMLFDILGGEFFSDSLTTMQGKEAYEQLQGYWILETGELASMRKAEVEQVKHFLHKREDSYRPSYGRNTVNYKRQCIIVGTTNKDDFLNDPTGGRSFWPVKVAHRMTNQKQIEGIRDQLWAEAKTLYEAGDRWWLEEDEEKAAEAIQKRHTEGDDRKELIIGYLNTLIPENWYNMNTWAKREFLSGDPISAEGTIKRKKITAFEVYTELFGGTAKDFDKRTAREINDILRTIPGWEYGSVKIDGVPVRGFYYKPVLS